MTVARDSVVIEERCGCGATFQIDGAPGFVSATIEAAAAWRRGHRHLDPTPPPAPLARVEDDGVGSPS